MFSQFIQKAEPDADQALSISVQWELPKPSEAPITIVKGEVSGGLAQLAEEENQLRSEKQLLLDIMNELENRLTSEIKTRKSTITTLRAEVSELQRRCEELARALNIHVIK